MSIRMITQFLSNIPLLRHRDTVNPNLQADKDDFVVKYEATNDHLATTTVTEVNIIAEQINNTVDDMILAVDEVEANAMIAQSIGNYQGVWNSTTAYLKNQSVSIGNLFYTAKANNTNISTSNTDYWLSNPINNKLNTNISTYDEKTTPINADLIPLCDSADAFAIKKLSWANLKTTLSSLFVSKISSPVANTLVKVNADGSIANTNITEDIEGILHIPKGAKEFLGLLPLVGNDESSYVSTSYTKYITNLDNLKVSGKYNTFIHTSNQPVYDWGFVDVYVHSNINETSNPDWVVQVWYGMGTEPVSKNRMFIRSCVAGTWTAWVEK